MEDIAHTADGDIDLADDLTRTEPTAQHERDLLLAGQGDFKEAPDMGVNCIDFMMDNDPSNLLRAVRKQCQKDGMRVRDVRYGPSGELIIDARYADDPR